MLQLNLKNRQKEKPQKCKVKWSLRTTWTFQVRGDLQQLSSD